MAAGRRETEYEPDDLDRQMLALLRDDARLTVVELGRRLSLGHATAHARLRRLEAAGLVRGYHAELDYARLGLGLSAYVGLQIQQSETTRTRLAEHLRSIPEVESCAWVTGDFDVMLRIRARDTLHLQDVVFRAISAGGPSQIRTRTMVVLSEPFSKPGPSFEEVLPPDA
jgi:Lrp/AsnC family transcriptional regulator, regulator for asnA, asnC and gidA